MEFFNLFSVPEGEKKARSALKRPLKFSYSAYKDITQCPAKYALARVLWLVPKTIDTRNFCLGSVGHSCMERWIKEGGFELGYMQSIAQDEFDLYLTKNTVVPLHARDLKELRDKSVTNAQALEDTFVEFGLHKKTLLSEKKWDVPLPNYSNVILTGVMDVMVAEDNLILDLKMTKNASFMDETQLNLYAMMGVLSGLKTTKAGFIVPLRKEKLVKVEFEAADFYSLLKSIQDELAVINSGLESGRWDYRYNKTSCFRCNVNKSCSRYANETRSVDRPVINRGSGNVIQF